MFALQCVATTHTTDGFVGSVSDKQFLQVLTRKHILDSRHVDGGESLGSCVENLAGDLPQSSLSECPVTGAHLCQWLFRLLTVEKQLNCCKLVLIQSCNVCASTCVRASMYHLFVLIEPLNLIILSSPFVSDTIGCFCVSPYFKNVNVWIIRQA